MLPVVTMRVHCPDCLPFVIHSCDVATTPSGLLQIVGDNLPRLHAPDSAYFPLHTARDDHCHIHIPFSPPALRRNTRSDKSPSQDGNNAVSGTRPDPPFSRSNQPGFAGTFTP